METTLSVDVYEVWAAQCVNRSCVASLTFLVWDVLTTWDEELAYIWRKPLTWTRFLFVFIRYFAIAVQVALLFVGTEIVAPPRSSGSCYGWFIFQALAMQILITSVEVVLMLRVRALYAHNVLVRHTVLSLLVLEVIVMATCEYYTVAGLAFDQTCIVTRSSAAILGYGAAAIIYELFLFTLTLIKFVHALRTGWSDTPVLQLLMRDGSWAFGLIFLAMLANAVCYGAISGGLSAVAFTWLMSVLAFAGCRLMLNLHALGAPAAQTPYTTREREADRSLHGTFLDFVHSDRGLSGGASTDTTTECAEEVGAYVLKDLGRGGKDRKREGKSLGVCSDMEKVNPWKGKGKGKMSSLSTTPTTGPGRDGYRRSPLSTLSIDFASFGGTVSSSSGAGSSTFDSGEARGLGYGNEVYPTTRAIESQNLESHVIASVSAPREEPTSPGTPLSSDLLMFEWHDSAVVRPSSLSSTLSTACH